MIEAVDLFYDALIVIGGAGLAILMLIAILIEHRKLKLMEIHVTDRTLADLSPTTRKGAIAFLAACNKQLAPSRVSIIVTYRAAADQEAAKAAGLSKAGAGQSPHNCVDEKGAPSARAFDFAVFGEDGAYVTDGTDPRYAAAGKIAEGLELEWGGSWTVETDGCGPDFDHIELPNWKACPG